jgi:hypothetical protein
MMAAVSIAPVPSALAGHRHARLALQDRMVLDYVRNTYIPAAGGTSCRF